MPDFNIRLVGANYRPIEAQAIVSDLDVGESVYLIREPDNKFDVNAIKIYNTDNPDTREHLGYVAAKSRDSIAVAEEVSMFMELDTWYEAVVITDAGTKSPLLNVILTEDYEVA